MCTFITNLVEYADSERMKAQRIAQESWEAANATVLDFPATRTAITALEYEKDVPFLKDMLDWVCNNSKREWIGYTNSDIIFKPDFFHFVGAGKGAEENGDAFTIAREDISPCDTLEKAWRSATKDKSLYPGRDVIMMKREVWEKIRDKVPNFLIGEPQWDIFMYALLKENCKLIDISMPPSPIRHMQHAPTWNNDSEGAKYNKGLFKQSGYNLGKVWAEMMGKTHKRSLLFSLPARNGDIIAGSMIANQLVENFDLTWITTTKYEELVKCVCPKATIVLVGSGEWIQFTTAQLKENWPDFECHVNAQFGAAENHDEYMNAEGLHPVAWLKGKVEKELGVELSWRFKDFLIFDESKITPVPLPNKPFAVLAPKAITAQTFTDEMLEVIRENTRKLDLELLEIDQSSGYSFVQAIYVIKRAKYFFGQDSGLSWAALYSDAVKSIHHTYERYAKTYNRFGFIDPLCQDWIVGPKVPGCPENIRLLCPLPMQIFTIVQNGEPFIEKHLKIFEQLPFDWSWDIIEGMAELSHDTAWAKQYGGAVTDDLHKDFLSTDGTTQYLDSIKDKRVKVHRKKGPWTGKIEMVNAPGVPNDCILKQIDSDEFWTVEQLVREREIFAFHPEKNCAYFRCNYYVGPGIVTKGEYGNRPSEWIRSWVVRSGAKFSSHEPPKLEGFSENPFTQFGTERAGLVFNHYAYVSEASVKFKEIYYGYKGLHLAWRKLQERKEFPIKLKDAFPMIPVMDKDTEIVLVENYRRSWRRTIALNMIVGPGRAQELRIALEGANRMDFDEIVIGITHRDEAVEAVAREFADTVIYHPWQMDFALARNAVRENSTADMIFWLDSDDQIVNEMLPGLREAQEKVRSGNADVYTCTYATRISPKGRVEETCQRERWFRREFEWNRPIHETVYPPKGAKIVGFPGAYIIHVGRPGSRVVRNLRILERYAMASGDPVLRFYYGQELIHINEAERGVPILEDTLGESGLSDNYVAHGYLQIARLLAYENRANKIGPRWVEAKEYIAKSLKKDQNIAEAWIILGDILDHEDKLVEANAAYKQAFLTKDLPGFPVETKWKLTIPHDRLCRLYSKMGSWEMALHHNAISLGQDPDNPRLIDNRKMLVGKLVEGLKNYPNKQA